MMTTSEFAKFGRALALAVPLLGMAVPSLSADGQIVINQSKAKAGNITPGDAAGFPVTLSRSGSYVLSSNLTVPVDKTGIQIAASDVTIDLNGFKITGSGLIGAGISQDAEPRRGATIRNGTIANFGVGIHLDRFVNTVVENMRAFNNSFTGMNLGFNSLIRGNVVSDNGQDGIFVAGASLVSGNTAIHNGRRGLAVDCPTSIVENVVQFNSESDISEFGGGCTRANNSPSP
jgi:parallel beta-helix repeat protein